jgi:hypothetical protein
MTMVSSRFQSSNPILRFPSTNKKYPDRDFLEILDLLLKLFMINLAAYNPYSSITVNNATLILVTSKKI